MKTAWIVLLAIEPAFCGCIQISGEEIRARDLAPVVEAFAEADPEAILALTPSPGVRRVFTLRDLMSAAHRTGVADNGLPVAGVCLERALGQVTEQDLYAAMTAAFAGRKVEIGIVDYSRYGVPPGRLVFQLSGLSAPPPAQPDAPVLWRGRVLFDETRSMEIWGRVRISAAMTVCLAVTDIPVGKPIQPDQVRMAELPRFPLHGSVAIEDVASVVGRVARRPIRAGQEIVAQGLEEAREIRPGDTVRVEAISGNAHVILDAVATSAGRKGDAIVLQNPATHTSFRAVVDGRDRAVIHTGRGDGS
jgi:flagella basal body P-ring formation protein FlgA